MLSLCVHYQLYDLLVLSFNECHGRDEQSNWFHLKNGLALPCGLYYKHVTVVNDASSGICKLKASLNDAARGVIYDRHVFVIQATGVLGLT
jgi:hypothetical protein